VAQDPHALEEIVAAPAQSTELEGLTDALATLTEQQRHAILLREWHGLNYSEIADRLELSQAAVETLLFRARRSLARRLRQPLGIGSFLPWLRSLAGGSAAKIAIGAAAVAVTATTGAIAVARQHQHRPLHRSHPATRTPATPAAAATRAVAVPGRQASLPSPRVATAHTPAPDTPQQPVASAPNAAAPSTPAPVEPTATAHTITGSVPTTPTTDAAGTVVNTATTAAGTVTNSVSAAVGTVVDTAAATAANTVTTAQGVIDTVTTAVPTVTVPPLPLP
jgi:predicted DNA-binding protein (UPF0251 family)